jgi:hypothetical protein
MNKYECSTNHRTNGNNHPTREIEATNERQADMLYRQEVGLAARNVSVTVRFVGKVQEDRFSRFTR